MKRRHFAQSLLVSLGASSLPIGASMAGLSIKNEWQACKKITSEDGLVLNLDQVSNPTANNDRKQFILTYKVDKTTGPLQEKIYRLSVNGQSHDVYMTPVNNNQLQAVFNWRINA